MMSRMRLVDSGLDTAGVCVWLVWAVENWYSGEVWSAQALASTTHSGSIYLLSIPGDRDQNPYLQGRTLELRKGNC